MSLESIADAVGFIEANLKEEIAVADVADAVGYSLYHFCRLFNRFTHHTPYDYLMRRRVSESARDLVATRRKIIDVAFEYGFNSPETYSRAFKRLFGVLPSRWRQPGGAEWRLLMPRLTPTHLAHRSRGGLRPVLEERPAFRAAGLMILVEEGRKGIPELWGMLAAELAHLAEGWRSGVYYGITTYLSGREDGATFYAAAAGLRSGGGAGPVLVEKAIPALDWACFTHAGPPRDLYLTRDYVHHTWLPRAGRQLSWPVMVERYDRLPYQAGDDPAETGVLIPIGPAGS